MDNRSDLLKQIQNGKKLKKVNHLSTAKLRPVKSNPQLNHDVQVAVDVINSKNRNRTADPKNTNNVAELLVYYMDARYHSVQVI